MKRVSLIILFLLIGFNFLCGQRIISLKAYNGKYVCADKGLNGKMVANRSAIGPWETFQLIPKGGNKYALKTSYGKYVCADIGLGGRLYANREKIGPWETFEIIELGGGKIALKASNGKYVSADKGLGNILIANRDTIGEWEMFSMVYSSYTVKKTTPSPTISTSYAGMFSRLKYELQMAVRAGRDASYRSFLQRVRREFAKPPPVRGLSKFSHVRIKDIEAAPNAGKRVLTSGGSLLVVGENFGNSHGSISIVLNSPANGRTRFDLLPGNSRGWSYNWRDNVINAKVPEISGIVKAYNGRLIINSKVPNSVPAELPIVLIPEMTIKQISGRKYFKLAKRDKNDTFRKENNFLIVVHNPGCGIKGNQGNDTFDFRGLVNKSPLIKIKKIVIVQIDPKNEKGSYAEMLARVREIYNLIKGNFKSVIMFEAGKWVAELVLKALVPKYGSYVCRVVKTPTQNDPTLRIHWENTCWGDYGGKDLVYMATFFILTPEGMNL